jgi:tetraacyldisaccharide 4'-kinase
MPAIDLALGGLSRLFGVGVRLRHSAYRSGWLKRHRLPCKVVSVGNLTVGGTGKTPVTLFVAETLVQAGCRVAILSRGYRGKAETAGGMVGDGGRLYMDPATAGDEPYLMALRLLGSPVAVYVGKDRGRMGDLAVGAFDPDVILLDDGFQHLRLARDVDLVLLDAKKPFGNSHLLPRGGLREPAAALSRATAVILTRVHGDGDRSSVPPPVLERHLAGRPLFAVRHRLGWFAAAGCGTRGGPSGPERGAVRPLADLRGRTVVAFSGIARNAEFRADLEREGIAPSGFRGFPDHHRYTPEDLSVIARLASQRGAEVVLTTEKDWVKLPFPLCLPAPLGVVRLEVDLRGAREAFDAFLWSALKR